MDVFVRSIRRDRMTTLLALIESRIERFVVESPAFQAACERRFAEADKDADGRLTFAEVVAEVDAVFSDLKDVLTLAQIEVKKPSQKKISELLKKADVDQDSTLDQEEFGNFYRQVLKLAAFNGCLSFMEKYGAAVIAGAASFVALKTGQDRVGLPPRLKSVLGYAGPLFSIVVGLVARFGQNTKKSALAERRLFTSPAVKRPKA